MKPAIVGKVGPAMQARKSLGFVLGAQAKITNSFCRAGLCRTQEKAR